jgi:hypothetical protein
MKNPEESGRDSAIAPYDVALQTDGLLPSSKVGLPATTVANAEIVLPPNQVARVDGLRFALPSS